MVGSKQDARAQLLFKKACVTELCHWSNLGFWLWNSGLLRVPTGFFPAGLERKTGRTLLSSWMRLPNLPGCQTMSKSDGPAETKKELSVFIWSEMKWWWMFQVVAGTFKVCVKLFWINDPKYKSALLNHSNMWIWNASKEIGKRYRGRVFLE